jgi:hypothetical protein
MIFGLLLLIVDGNGFYLISKSFQPLTRIQSSMQMQLLPRKLVTVLIANAIGFNSLPTPVYSAVGEGDLPPGAMAFNKILKYQVSKYPRIFASSHLTLL